MYKTSKKMRKMCVLAGMMVLAVTASALPLDTHITIDRALNSPTLTIRYSGAHAALVELRLNGESLGTRSMTAAKDAGETNFNITLSELKDGDNDVEVLLYDRVGKLVGTEKTNISTDQSNRGPVFLASPKVGATVRGPVEIQLSFSRDIKNSIASFFVDGNFKAMSNYPPYTYTWDTLREQNGWHEVEAWDVDESSQTFKTKKTRVFVDNPGGPTTRPGVSSELRPSKNAYNATADGVPSSEKAMTATGKSKGTYKPAGVEPRLNAETMSNTVKGGPTLGASGPKPAPSGIVVAMGPKMLTPNGHHTVTASKSNPGVIKIDVHPSVVASTQGAAIPKVITGLEATSHMLAITRGQRVPNLGQFAIAWNSQFIKFDVQPRVDEGVPMTPLRYLLEKGGGKVDWQNMTKTVTASADGKSIVIQIGDRNAKVDQVTISMEVTPYIDRGRTIVPLSFIHDALGVNVEYDKETGHVLITSAK